MKFIDRFKKMAKMMKSLHLFTAKIKIAFFTAAVVRPQIRPAITHWYGTRVLTETEFLNRFLEKSRVFCTMLFSYSQSLSTGGFFDACIRRSYP